MLVACDFLMDTNGNRIWVHLNTQWKCVHDFSRGSLQHTLGHGGNRHDQGFAFKRDMCGVVMARFEGLTHCVSFGLSVLVCL